VAHPVFKTGGARHTALEGSTPSPFRMSDRDLPSADQPATAARAGLQLLVQRMLSGDEAREVARAASP
jgi:hypothetical protein